MPELKEILFTAYKKKSDKYHHATDETLYKIRACDCAVTLWEVILEADLSDEYYSWEKQNEV